MEGIVKHTPGGDDICHAVSLLLQKEMTEADLDSECYLERVYLEPEASPTVSTYSEDDSDSTESDVEYHSESEPDVDMRMQDDVEAPDRVDLDIDVDVERDGKDEEDEEKKDEKEEEVVDEDEEEEEEEDNGKEPRMIGKGEMVNTSADDSDTIVDDAPTMRPEQCQEMRKHTPQPQPLAPAAWPQTPEPPPVPQTPETHSLSELEF
jgi:hypothetical protein